MLDESISGHRRESNLPSSVYWGFWNSARAKTAVERRSDDWDGVIIQLQDPVGM